MIRLRKPLANITQATPDWLTQVLRDAGCLPQGRVVAAHAGERILGGSIVVPLELGYTADAPASAPTRLILKIPEGLFTLPEDQVLEAAEREVVFYSRVAPSMPDPPAIRCYDVGHDEETGHYHLLMEDLRETHVGHPPSMLPPPKPRAGLIADALAQVHAHWWDHARLGQDVGTLPTETSLREAMAWNETNYRAFADFLGDRLPPARRDVYERVLASFLPVQLERLASGRHLTLVHDDPHAGNFLYPRDPTRDTLRIIDWKSWRISVGPGDMAHMMAVFWFPERRAWLEWKLLKRYHACLVERGVEGYDWDACWYDYRFAVIGYLFYPIWQWTTRHRDLIWWHHLERLMLAFQDLECGELLDT